MRHFSQQPAAAWPQVDEQVPYLIMMIATCIRIHTGVEPVAGRLFTEQDAMQTANIAQLHWVSPLAQDRSRDLPAEASYSICVDILLRFKHCATGLSEALHLPNLTHWRTTGYKRGFATPSGKALQLCTTPFELH